MNKIYLDNSIVNVLIPAYKAHKFIEKTLDSIQYQTWDGIIKIFVCVDGCKKTLKKIKQIQYKYKNLTIMFCKENKGTYVTINTMLSVIKSGTILVFGADDNMHKNMIEEIMKENIMGVVRNDGVLVAPIEKIK
ncbi:glycosyltransferase family 2 protein, partial [bacterium]|nr:glycosyltransferase family 2 protein [bacterium]